MPEDGYVQFDWSFTPTVYDNWGPIVTYRLSQCPGLGSNGYTIALSGGQEHTLDTIYPYASGPHALAGPVSYYFKKCQTSSTTTHNLETGNWSLTITYTPVALSIKADLEKNDDATTASQLSINNMATGSIGFLGGRGCGGTNNSRFLNSYDHKDFYKLDVNEFDTIKINTVVSDGLKYTQTKDRLKLYIYDTDSYFGVILNDNYTIDTIQEASVTLDKGLSPPVYLVAELLEYEDGHAAFGKDINGTYEVTITLPEKKIQNSSILKFIVPVIASQPKNK